MQALSANEQLNRDADRKAIATRNENESVRWIYEAQQGSRANAYAENVLSKSGLAGRVMLNTWRCLCSCA